MSVRVRARSSERLTAMACLSHSPSKSGSSDAIRKLTLTNSPLADSVVKICAGDQSKCVPFSNLTHSRFFIRARVRHGVRNKPNSCAKQSVRVRVRVGTTQAKTSPIMRHQTTYTELVISYPLHLEGLQVDV